MYGRLLPAGHPAAGGASCSDLNACNGAETCQGGICTPGTALDCDDGDPGTIDSCNPSTGCQHTPAACTTDADCTDGNTCNGAETCQGGTCTAGTALDCDDGDPATIDSCDPFTGCQHTPDPGCDDSNVCTDDSNDGGTCQHAPVTNGTSCSDLNLCNGPETCQGGTCTPGTALNCSDSDPNTMEWCDPTTGCRHRVLISDSRCDDAIAATFAWERIASRCGCDENPSRGEYLRCVARAAAEAVADGLPTSCKPAIKRCATRSTCGKPNGSVTCCFALRGSCKGSLCQDGVTPCAGAQDCPPRTRCRVRASAGACNAGGGAPGSAGSCCDFTCSLP